MQITQDEIIAQLGDRWWRLNNLYYIKTDKGKKILFRPNKHQKRIHDGLHFFNIVPKARQLGMTTFFSILYLDQILFSENKTAAIIAHKEVDMKKIFKEKIRFAWDNLHPWLRSYIGDPKTDSAYEMSFPNGSSISVSMSTRSGTVQFLHISEFGYICQKFPDRAEEIVTGSINSVAKGCMVSVESTAAGKEGYFYDFTMEADKMAKEGRELTEFDWKLFFFPWWIHPDYNMDDKTFALEKETIDYFDKLERKLRTELAKHLGRDHFTMGQKRWYQKKMKINQSKMYAEYPSTLEEAFQTAIEGAYYTKQMEKVYLENRIQPIPHDTMLQVDTYWDLGMNDDNVILFVQSLGPQIRFINIYRNSGEGLKHYVEKLAEWKEKYKYNYGRHYLPHDVEVRELGTGVSRRQTLVQSGLKNIIVVPKIGNINDGIDMVRRIFSRFYFDEVNASAIHEALFNYRKGYDKKLGVWKNKPQHDDNAHIADAVRAIGQMWREEVKEHDGDSGNRDQSFF